LSGRELDRVYELPYEREYHPSYQELGGVPALEEVKFSIIHNRGCFGACAFCSLAYHQGRTVTARTEESIVSEAKILIAKPDFKGYIHDVGGPTANFRGPSCDAHSKNGMCKGKRCLAPEMCPSVTPDHTEYLGILRRLRNLDGVKKVFVRSGIRYDYLIADKNETFFKELIKHHISGQLKVAPEHCTDRVLDYMGKPRFAVYQKFQKRFYELTKAAGKEQYLVPYMISSHPGSTLTDAVELAIYLKKEKMRPEQVQDFYPTPGTVSTCMYYTGLDPYSLTSVYVPRTPKEKAQQRALLQYHLKENADIVRDALEQAGRRDLIGHGGAYLVLPRAGTAHSTSSKKNAKKPSGRKRKR
jgi:Fe-S oxidoreductase